MSESLSPYVIVAIPIVLVIVVYLLSKFLNRKHRYPIDLEKLLGRDGAEVAGEYRVMIMDEDPGLSIATLEGKRTAPVKGFEQIADADAFAVASTTADGELTAFVFDSRGKLLKSFRSGERV